ncbi:ankyrin [Penicillium sp. DV-2018c]|nr:ankyrin [Penicillium sp. DV-2018c]
MQSTSASLSCLPAEILEMITAELEYASEVNSLSQTCRRLYSIANHRLFKHFAKQCSPRGFDRVVTNNNANALHKLLANRAHFDEYFSASDYATPIPLTVEKDLSEVARLLVVYMESALEDSEMNLKYHYMPGYRYAVSYEDELVRTMCCAAGKGKLGVLKVTLSSKVMYPMADHDALVHAVHRGQFETARYLVEEAGVNINHKILVRGCYKTYLAHAAHGGNLEMVKFLVDAGADLKWPNYNSIAEPPLYIAAAKNYDAIVQYLIEKGLCFSPLHHHDLSGLVENSAMPNYKTSRIVTGDDIRALFTNPPHELWISYNSSSLTDLAAVCGDQSLFRDILQLPDSRIGQDQFVAAFAKAGFHGQIPFMRYLVGEMRKLKTMFSQAAWKDMISYTVDYDNVPAFDILLDCGPPADLLKVKKRWLDKLLSKTVRHPGHIKPLLDRGFLDKVKDIKILKCVFAGAFKLGELPVICRLLHISEFGICDILHDPGLHYYETSILQIAAQYSYVETFQEILTTHNLTLDPCHPVHGAALVTAAIASNVEVLELFFENGFDVNGLYKLPSAGSETLLIRVAMLHLPVDEDESPKITSDDIIATAEYLLDRGAHIDAKDSQGRTALSIALETRQPRLARLLFNKGADPLLDFQSHRNLGGLEQLIRLFTWDCYDISLLDMLQAFLELMAARGYESDEFLRLLPKNEGTLDRPTVKLEPANTPGLEGPVTRPDYNDRLVKWSHFFLIKELRKQYWRTRYPVSLAATGGGT